MKKSILILYFLGFYFGVSAQSEGYRIESFQDTYEELTEYESVALLSTGSPIWFVEFDLNFQFPFYGSFYESIIYRTDLWASVTQNEDNAFFIMDFFDGYAYDWVTDTTNIVSDYRFGHVFKDGLQAFVLQATDVSFFAPPNEDEYNSRFNFQICFYENGVIEARYGDCDMDGNPIYAPGKGFHCYTTNGGIDTSEICGPLMSISNPNDEDDAIALDGDYINYEVTGEPYSILNTIPPPGWVIRFAPKTVSLADPTKANQLRIHPNPASYTITVSEETGHYEIYDLLGILVKSGELEGSTLNVSDLQPGNYIMRVESDKNISIGRFLVASH